MRQQPCTARDCGAHLECGPADSQVLLWQVGQFPVLVRHHSVKRAPERPLQRPVGQQSGGWRVGDRCKPPTWSTQESGEAGTTRAQVCGQRPCCDDLASPPNCGDGRIPQRKEAQHERVGQLLGLCGVERVRRGGAAPRAARGLGLRMAGTAGELRRACRVQRLGRKHAV